MNDLVRSRRLKWVKSQIRRAKGRFNRFVDALLPRRPYETTRWEGRPTLTIVCDDGPKTDLVKVVPILDDHEIPGVFAITNDLIGAPGHMDIGDLRALHSAGHEIASHMHTHRPLDMILPYQLSAALMDAQQGLAETLQGQEVRSLVFPYGYNSRTIRRLVHEQFSCGVSAWPGINHGGFNRYAIRREPFGSYTKPGKNQLQWYLHLLDQTVARKAWLVLMIHTASTEHDAYQSACLRILLEQARDRGVRFATLNGAMDMIDRRSESESPQIELVSKAGLR